MTTALHLIDKGPFTLAAAQNTDSNIINLWKYDLALKEIYKDLNKQKSTIAALVKHHLGLEGEDILVLPTTEWIHGSFNICIPIQVMSGQICRKFILRCPMPHKLAEVRFPGTIDEKMSCEIGAYVWMQENCPNIRIPLLYGFGFSDRRHFTHESHRPWYIRLPHIIRRHVYRFFRGPTLSSYISNQTDSRFITAYMLLEHIGPDVGQMLSRTWKRQHDDPSHKERLFRSISQIILSLARIPQSNIGSFQFHNNSTVTLTNRPLTSTLMILENDGAPRTIHRQQTYQYTEPFVADMLKYHDNEFLSNRNAAYDDRDCCAHMATRAILRAVSHHYINPEFRNGPFFLQLTDLHVSNIFVDNDWNITCLLDLEWICALPVEMVNVPYWLSGCDNFDDLEGHRLTAFNEVRQEFMRIFKQEEEKTKAEHHISLTQTMNHNWQADGVWFWHIMNSVGAIYTAVEGHIYNRFSANQSDISKIEQVLSILWRQDCKTVIRKKNADYIGYIDELTLLVKKDGIPIVNE